MRNVELGSSGVQVSQLALGCMIMGTRTDEQESVRILNDYLDQGGNFLDTANCYAWWHARGTNGGQSEELLGRWFATDPSRRDRVFLATKGTAALKDPVAPWRGGGDEPEWIDGNFEGAGADTLRRNLDDSLRRLRTDHIDLYYVHVDDRDTPLEESLEALAGFVAAGKIRYYGWSNVRAWRLARIQALCERYGWPAPVAVQQLHSYLRRRAGLDDASVVDDEQLDYLRANPQATLVAYSPILQGLYDDPAKRATSRLLADRFRGPDADARLAAIDAVAAETGATPGQVVLAWLLAQDDPTIVPLIGPRTFEQYRAALPALDLKLSAEQLDRLDAAGA